MKKKGRDPIVSVSKTQRMAPWPLEYRKWWREWNAKVENGEPIEYQYRPARKPNVPTARSVRFSG